MPLYTTLFKDKEPLEDKEPLISKLYAHC